MPESSHPSRLFSSALSRTLSVNTPHPIDTYAHTAPLHLSRRSFVTIAVLSATSYMLFSHHAFADEASDNDTLANTDEDTEEIETTDETDESSSEEDVMLEAANTSADLRTRIVALQADLEEASDAYYQALSEQQAAETAMEEAQVSMEAAESRLVELKSHLSNRARALYRSGSVSVFDFLFGVASFDEFATNLALLQRLNNRDASLISETRILRDELAALRDEYARQKEIAELEANTAEAIRVNIETRISVAYEYLADLDAAAQGLLSLEQAEEAVRRAQEQAFEVDFTTDPVAVPDHNDVVEYALSRLGCPYVWGAEGPDSFDCSGLVKWCYAQTGVELPHYSEDLYYAATNRIPIADSQPGDVLYRYGHVGIVQEAGGLPYIHAPTFNAYVRNTDSLEWAGFVCALQFT